MILKGGPNTYGIPIGVLCLESYYVKIPGHIKNATTFEFPVVYKTVEGARGLKLLNEPDSLLEPFIEAARALEKEGVLAVTGSCGFLAGFQKSLADAVNIPVFISSLMQIPMVYNMLRSDQKVGVITATKNGLTKDHLRGVGAESVPMCVAGMEGQQEFWEVILEHKRQELDVNKLENEVVNVAEALVAENKDIGAIVIECTDMPPFAYKIQQKVQLPIFDIITLTKMVYYAVVYNKYGGYMPL